MNEDEKSLVALDKIWRKRIVAKIEGTIKRREGELKELKDRLKDLTNGETLPLIERENNGRYVWFCTQCDGIAGKNFLVHTIPFAKDSVCTNCQGRSSHDLMAIAKGETDA